jgi:hypothetical protein
MCLFVLSLSYNLFWGTLLFFSDHMPASPSFTLQLAGLYLPGAACPPRRASFVRWPFGCAPWQALDIRSAARRRSLPNGVPPPPYSFCGMRPEFASTRLAVSHRLPPCVSPVTLTIVPPVRSAVELTLITVPPVSGACTSPCPAAGVADFAARTHPSFPDVVKEVGHSGCVRLQLERAAGGARRDGLPPHRSSAAATRGYSL